jgi:hypothetical protein
VKRLAVLTAVCADDSLDHKRKKGIYDTVIAESGVPMNKGIMKGLLDKYSSMLYKAFPPRSYALRWFEHFDITSFQTFDDFVRVFRLRFEMQEAGRDKLLIHEQRLCQREQDDVNDYVTVL